MGGRSLIEFLYYRQLTTAVKRCFAFYERFSSFDVKRFPQPLYRCVLLRLVEDQREESLNEAENVTIVTTYEVSKRLIGSNKEFLTKHRYTSVIVQCIRSDNSEQRVPILIKRANYLAEIKIFLYISLKASRNIQSIGFVFWATGFIMPTFGIVWKTDVRLLLF